MIESGIANNAFQLGPKMIGPGHSCLIIGEVGSNHNGDLEQAKALIDVAAEAGADAVKFQAYRADKIAAQTNHPMAKHEFGDSHTLHELYKNHELPQEWLPDLKEYSESLDLIFLCSPFDEDSADALHAIGTVGYKVASFEMTHHPFLRHLAKMGRPLLISTGLATLGEVEESLAVVRSTSDVPVALFHCGSQYPLDYGDVNLRAIDTMQHALGVPVGYSDHTLGITVPIAAVARGAHLIEKHYTLSRQMTGPDHGFALEPGELAQMIKMIRQVEAALGSPIKNPSQGELIQLEKVRRSLFAKVRIPKGAILEEDMLAILRPGVGLAPKYRDVVVGHRASRDIEAHEPISWDMI